MRPAREGGGANTNAREEKMAEYLKASGDRRLTSTPHAGRY